ncbi:hypothetical protein EVAR_85427_1 [Eumeta japonica]|uniref:Uncharacterized protein n=1 Tax=Eumeta variegata TaxID=151549 RepID=A0A4C1WIE4_EUMVA|nr:hypothetical protein EVAR_85427_1 [Eumeta japonica]
MNGSESEPAALMKFKYGDVESLRHGRTRRLKQKRNRDQIERKLRTRSRASDITRHKRCRKSFYAHKGRAAGDSYL